MSFWSWVAERVHPYTDLAFQARLNNLEKRMSKIDEALAELDEVTDVIAERLDVLIANAAQMDGTTAERIHAVADHLRALAKDPENVSPDEVPQTPAPSQPEWATSGGDSDVPGTQAGADTEQQTGTQGIAGIG